MFCGVGGGINKPAFFSRHSREALRAKSRALRPGCASPRQEPGLAARLRSETALRRQSETALRRQSETALRRQSETRLRAQHHNFSFLFFNF